MDEILRRRPCRSSRRYRGTRDCVPGERERGVKERAGLTGKCQGVDLTRSLLVTRSLPVHAAASMGMLAKIEPNEFEFA